MCDASLKCYQYTGGDFERIAAKLCIKGIDAEKIASYRQKFDGAAFWYATMQNCKVRIPNKKVSLDLKTIARSAERLVRHGRSLSASRSNVSGSEDTKDEKLVLQPTVAKLSNAIDTLLGKLSVTRETACDGLPDDFIKVFLQRPGDKTTAGGKENHSGNEEQIVTDLLETLADADSDITAITKAAAEIARRAHLGLEETQKLRGKMLLPGFSGNAADNGWIDDMLNLYMEITNRPIIMSTIDPSKEMKGTPSGPLIRFLAAAGEPVGLTFSPFAWESRVATAKKAYAQKKT
jgi:hypothetical protein